MAALIVVSRQGVLGQISLFALDLGGADFVGPAFAPHRSRPNFALRIPVVLTGTPT